VESEARGPRLRGSDTSGLLRLGPELFCILHLVLAFPPVSSRRVSSWPSLGQRKQRCLRVNNRSRRTSYRHRRPWRSDSRRRGRRFIVRRLR